MLFYDGVLQLTRPAARTPPMPPCLRHLYDMIYSPRFTVMPKDTIYALATSYLSHIHIQSHTLQLHTLPEPLMSPS